MTRGGGGGSGPEIEIVNMVIDTMTVQAREIRDIHPLAAGQEAGVVTGSGMSMRTTQAMGTMGGRRTSVGTDNSERIRILYIRTC